MNKKEYIETLTNLIINRVRFHAPNFFNSEVDFELLSLVGIDASLPLFKFDKPLNGIFYQAFLKAGEYIDFNLILTATPQVSGKRIAKLKHCFILKEEELGNTLLESINSININYRSHSDFKVGEKRDFIKINGKEIDLDYRPYELYKKQSDNNIIFEVREFLLNGKNFLLDFTNPYKEKKECSFEININLPRGYYYFKRDKNCVTIESLCNKDRAYFNFNCQNAKIVFSSISGLESATEACINFKLDISLNPKEQKRFYFNFGENKYNFTSIKDALLFYEISQIKANEIFDLKVKTKDIEFDNLFNLYTPRKIWESWVKNLINEESENFYLKTREKIIQNFEKGVKICEDFKGLKEIRLYRNFRWKRVFIIKGESRYIFANKVKYFNFDLLTKDIFKKNNEIYLSFGN